MNFQNNQNKILKSSSDTKRTMMHLLTNSAQRELVSICTQSTLILIMLTVPLNIFYFLGQESFIIDISHGCHKVRLSRDCPTAKPNVEVIISTFILNKKLS